MFVFLLQKFKINHLYTFLIYNYLMDRLTKEQRHKNMQAVKNKDSKIELLLRHALWNKGYRYRKNYTKIEGKPDIVLTKYKTVVIIGLVERMTLNLIGIFG